MGMILRIERTSTRKKDVEGLSCGFEGICFGSRHINATSMKTLHGMERKKATRLRVFQNADDGALNLPNNTMIGAMRPRRIVKYYCRNLTLGNRVK